MLYGYGDLIFQGAWMTIKLALFSALLAMALGLIGATAKLFGSRVSSSFATLYSTIIRGIPDLVLMMLIFYGLQIVVNQITESFGWSQLNIDPFIAGTLTIGFIYGAYLTETFRGAFLAVSKGQIEASTAYGMTSWQTFIYVLFPQMMRHALPGMENNWLVILKSTALVSIIGLADLVKATQMAGKGTYQFFMFTIVAAIIYLVFTTLSNLIFVWLGKRYEFERGAARC
ncbi:histidine ABC transporter permease HisQ [Vibrio sp.]|uniref:Histidine ABC transporter permease HisQ n=1 Tax=Vibrio viridaestus TaxID=2487322 RepID=A0A3N9U1M1_9VIBR|nr:histidine ABC transporter permease HisQ [Vibrio viridaestus]MDC0611489.1 histidine ABC transporter permease HisQ [Vibrio sp.]RQW61816.1 histidine ABC transporter permease HisQ [Vibrio viridaestus]